jgi:hypothetical protein
MHRLFQLRERNRLVRPHNMRLGLNALLCRSLTVGLLLPLVGSTARELNA